MKIHDTATTNKLLLLLVIPLAFYLLHIFGFIFAPLMIAFFITLLFMPMIRWLLRKKIPRVPTIGVILTLVVVGMSLLFYLIKLSGKEIIEGKDQLYLLLDTRVGQAIAPYAQLIGIKTDTYSSTIKSILFSDQVREVLFGNFNETLVLLQQTASFLLMTLFFLVLLLAGSLNLEAILGQTLFTSKTRSVRTYMVIERSIARFLKVKFLMSFFTGIGFSLVAWIAGLSFPLFWGLLAFSLNFVQMIGSIVSTLLVIVYAFIEINQPQTLLILSISFTMVQVIFGSILEPILMGKSFKINIITILVMLMFWGYLWGIPGLILSIPVTVFIKTMLEQFENTRKIARLMS
ncbi:MAG: AI-2E family transporter [Bacteroidales bacterium]|nr:AI-2E family transporter [Bacteroidales bacterium]